jgi:hypothetical protein
MMEMKHADVVALLGPVDETMQAAILATGASAHELAQAIAWLDNDEALIGAGDHLPDSRVRALIDILAADLDEDDRRDRLSGGAFEGG